MKIFLIIFTYLSTSLCFANNFSKAKKQCLESNQQPTCKVVYHEQYTIDTFSKGYSYTLNAISPVVITLVESVDSIVNKYINDNIKLNQTKTKNREKAKDIKEKLISIMKKKAIKSKFNECQKACLVKCITSTIMTYKMDRSNTKTAQPIDHYLSQKGVCTEFAELATDISQSLGLEVRSTYNLGQKHAYNEFYIDGQWVYFEPQTKECTFFESSLEQHSINEVKTQKLSINNDKRQLDFRNSKIAKLKKDLDFTKSLQR